MNSQRISFLSLSRCRSISPNLRIRRTSGMLLCLHDFRNRPIFMYMSFRRIRRDERCSLRQMSDDIIPSFNRVLFSIMSIKPIWLRKVNGIGIFSECFPIRFMPAMSRLEAVSLRQTNPFIPKLVQLNGIIPQSFVCFQSKFNVLLSRQSKCRCNSSRIFNRLTCAISRTG